MYPKDKPSRLTRIFSFSWYHSWMSLNFYYRTVSLGLYPSSAYTNNRSLEKPRVLWNVLVKTFYSTEGEICVRFLPVFLTTASCPITSSCVIPGDKITSACGIDTPGADISCKINRSKESYFAKLFLSRPQSMTIYWAAHVSINCVQQPCNIWIKPVLWDFSLIMFKKNEL